MGRKTPPNVAINLTGQQLHFACCWPSGYAQCLNDREMRMASRKRPAACPERGLNQTWEVRSTLRRRGEARVLFGSYADMLIALHAFIKKTQKTAPDDLAVARQRLKEMSS